MDTQTQNMQVTDQTIDEPQKNEPSSCSSLLGTSLTSTSAEFQDETMVMVKGGEKDIFEYPLKESKYIYANISPYYKPEKLDYIQFDVQLPYKTHVYL